MTEPYHKHIQMPEQTPGLSSEFDVPTAVEANAWTVGDRTGRVLLRNYGTRVVVCSPVIPHTFRTTPVFTQIGIEHYRTDPEYFPAVLEAVEAHLEPDEPAACWYGIMLGDDQLLSNTPARLVEDVTWFQRHLTELRRPDGSLGVDGSGVDYYHEAIVAGLWPTPKGWFYLEGRPSRFQDSFDWEYGLLSPGPLVDTSDVISFFAETSGLVPPFQLQWPERSLFATSVAATPIEHTELIETGHAASPIALSASNPFYIDSSYPVREAYDQIPNYLFYPLRETTTLLYHFENPEDATRPDETSYAAEEITLVESPTLGSMFVQAKAAMAR